MDTSFRSRGADDLAYCARSAPALMVFVGTGGPVSLHRPRFLPDDGPVGQVAAVMLAGYLDAKRSWRQTAGRRTAGPGGVTKKYLFCDLTQQLTAGRIDICGNGGRCAKCGTGN